MDFHALQKRQVFRPVAPSSITKEHQGIWDAWCFKGDREVAREAAAKGHVSLAVQFLSARKRIREDQAKDFINNEVFKWVSELLDRKQIFRVTHILTNVGIDPGPELIKVFYDTDKKYLRDYIGDYLSKTGQLTSDLQDLKNFLDVISENLVKLEQETISCLQQTSVRWKNEVAGKLFLTIQDHRLIPFLSAEVLWSLLVNLDKVELLKSWIMTSYSDENPENRFLPDRFVEIFKSFLITDKMLNSVQDSNCSVKSKDEILNVFCQFGKFNNHDSDNVVNILRRISQASNIHNIYNILNQKNSNLPLCKFTELFVKYCFDNNLLTVLNHCADKLDFSSINQKNYSLDLRLFLDIKTISKNFNGSFLCSNIFYSAKYLSNSSLEKYFCDNPLLFVSLLIFSQNLSVIKAIKDKSLIIQNVELFNTLESILNKYLFFKNICNRKVADINIEISYYDLVLKHLKVDVKGLYNLSGTSELPNFNSPQLIHKYGYQKKINYIFYIKECRPSKAYEHFLTSSNKEFVSKKIAKLGILNLENALVMASSIAFSEMINLNSAFLRVCFKSVRLLKEAGVDNTIIKNLFLNVNTNPEAIRTVLEDVVVKQIDFENLMLGCNFIDSIRLYDVVFRFSTMSNLPFPELFLKQCASFNLWLPFLLYAQMKQYPVAQMKALVPNFKNPNLVEHIVHSVMHDIQIEDLNILKGERNSRKYYLSRVGVRHSREQVTSEGLSYTSVSIASTDALSLDSLEIDVSNVKTTLLQTLIRCHNSTDPPRALLQACQLYKYPFLAIVATCYETKQTGNNAANKRLNLYLEKEPTLASKTNSIGLLVALQSEPDSVITNWIAWLSVSTDMYELFTSFETLTTSGPAIAAFLNKCMEYRYPKTLLESFNIFIPDNPLHYFVDFLCQIIFKKNDMNEIENILNKFRKAKNQRRGSIFSEKDYEMMYIKNKLWIETTSLKLLASAIAYNMESAFEQEEFVDILCQLKIESYFDCDTPNFNCLLNILKIISELNVVFDICKFFENENYVNACQNCIEDLNDKGLYEESLRVARCVDIETDKILLTKWKRQLKFDQTDNLILLQECDQNFYCEKVSPKSVVKFYLDQIQTVLGEDKYNLLMLAYKWSKLTNFIQTGLEIDIILAFLDISDWTTKIDDFTAMDGESSNLTFQEMVQKLENIETAGSFSEEIISKVGHLISIALDKKFFWLAVKLEKYFNCKSFDLRVLKTCHKLAEKIITPENLDKEQKSLLSKVKYLRTLSDSNKFQDLESTSFLTSDSAASTRQILTMIQCLVDKLEHGVELGRRIMRMYRMSINIDVPYYVILSETDPMKLVKLALEEGCFNKFEVINDYILSFKPKSKEICDFVSGEIIAASSDYVKSKTDTFSMWDLDMNTQLHYVLQLLKDDCSALGYKLYNYASVLHKAQLPNEFDFRISELALVVELLIIAHHCFTADCNMDGISIVLRKNRTLIPYLLTLRSWKLIVRLFIGTGRFSEMNYVFHILKEHDQFEYLLRKGSRKDDRLKEALLEYIRRFCPDNMELYKMVALHFTLYSEVAELWEREAELQIKDLIAISKLEMENDGLNAESEQFILFSNSAGTDRYLNKVLENYKHATEFHMKGEKLSRAMNSVRNCELIALQKSLFKSGSLDSNGSTVKATCLLNLNGNQITSLISKQLSFHQSHIVVQAYNFPADWASVIYEQYILRNNLLYLTDYMSLLSLNESLVQDISRKFIAANINATAEIGNMKNIIRKLVSVHAKYRIASELGFTDLVQELLDKEQLAYLKDTVWKKGYRNSN